MEEEDIMKWDFAKTNARDDEAIHKQMGEKKSTGGGASDPKAIGHHGHTLQFRDVADAIAKDRDPAIDGLQGRRSVEIILAIYKAAESGRAVKLPLKSDPTLKAALDAKAKAAAKK